MPTAGTERRHDLERSLEDLRAMRDELRVRAHLAGMEAKKKWTAVGPSLEQLETRVKRASRHFRESLSEMKVSLRSLFDKRH